MAENLPDTNVGNTEYIRKEDAKDALQEKVFHNLTDEFYGAMQVLDELEPADVAPVRHGRWIKTEDGAECEICGREAVYQIVDGRWKYEPWCPHCGAKMDGGDEHG